MDITALIREQFDSLLNKGIIIIIFFIGPRLLTAYNLILYVQPYLVLQRVMTIKLKAHFCWFALSGFKIKVNLLLVLAL